MANIIVVAADVITVQVKEAVILRNFLPPFQLV